MKSFEAPTLEIKQAVLKDVITASNPGSADGGVVLPPDPNF